MALPPALQAALAAKNTAAGTTPTAPIKPEDGNQPALETSVGTRSYQFPSAPSSFIMPDGRRLVAHDGVYTTAREDEIAELEAAVYVGNLTHFGDSALNSFQKPVLSEDRVVAGLNGQKQ